MTASSITKRLQALADSGNAKFVAGLVPNINPATIIGVRSPQLRQLARTLTKEGDVQPFLGRLPHRLFDENNLHAALVSSIKDYDQCLVRVNQFLPYVDNWATCDSLSPTCFSKNIPALLTEIPHWLASTHEYTVRFGIGMLMRHALDEHFQPMYLDQVAAIHTDAYYIRMMQAWYFATALAKQYDTTLPFITNHRLDPWTHRKAIQKAIESRRVCDEHKQHLRTLR